MSLLSRGDRKIHTARTGIQWAASMCVWIYGLCYGASTDEVFYVMAFTFLCAFMVVECSRTDTRLNDYGTVLAKSNEFIAGKDKLDCVREWMKVFEDRLQ